MTTGSGKEVLLAPRAKSDLKKLVNYLGEKFGWASAAKFVDHLERTSQHLADHPEIGMRIDALNRRYRIDRHSYLIYSITLNGIIVKAIKSFKQQREPFGPE